MSPGFHPKRRTRAFILFEAMLAVTIFALAALTLAKCVDSCLRAELLKEEDARARRVLENRMAEIEAGAVNVEERAVTTKLKDAFEGMTLKESRRELKRQNEKKQDITGLYDVTLELTWLSRGEKQSRVFDFYVFPKP